MSLFDRNFPVAPPRTEEEIQSEGLRLFEGYLSAMYGRTDMPGASWRLDLANGWILISDPYRVGRLEWPK